MSKDLFKRTEKKYGLSNKQIQTLKKNLNDRSFLVGNKTEYLIQNIYFDTDDDHLLIKSINKPVFKEKIRLRAYGLVNMESFVFLELKKKYKGIVYKRRSKMTLLEAYQLLYSHKMPTLKDYHNVQVLKEIEQFIKRYPLKEKAYVGYKRTAYEKNGLRITIDEDITTRHDDLRLEYGYKGQALLEDASGIMEVKSSKAMPLWFSDLLNIYEIYPKSFSKVGTDFIKVKQDMIIRKEAMQYVGFNY
jgi:SPX domain protein involved in polyphosphate accumulation